MSPDNTTAPTTTPTIRTNVVTFSDPSCTIAGMSIGTQWSISNAQPANWPPTVTPNLSPSGNSFNIEFDAGRNGTSPVADSYNTLCGSWENQWCTTYGFTGSPHDLNFYFEVDITLQHGGVQTTTTVYLGQGSVGWDNNWWIGGAGISYTGSFTVTIGDKLVTLNILASADNGFLFQLA